MCKDSSLECSKAELVHKSNDHLGKLESMVEVDSTECVLRRVDIRAAVIKSRLERKGRRVASPGGRGMVRASIAADRVDSGKRGVLLMLAFHQGGSFEYTYSSNDLLEVISQG